MQNVCDGKKKNNNKPTQHSVCDSTKYAAASSRSGSPHSSRHNRAGLISAGGYIKFHSADEGMTQTA